MNLILSLAVAALATAVTSEERSVGGATSGLTNLISGAPYPPAPPPAPYPPAAPPVHDHHPYTSWEQEPEQQGFTVQSGYEGFLLPTGPAAEPHSALLPLGVGGGLALGAGLLKHFLPFPFNKIAFFLTTKVGLWVAAIALLTLLGGAATTALCAFTPLCTISFLGLGKFNRETTRSLLSRERLDTLTAVVHEAIDTYRRLQNRVGKAAKGKKYKEAKEAKEAKLEESTTEARTTGRPVESDNNRMEKSTTVDPQ